MLIVTLLLVWPTHAESGPKRNEVSWMIREPVAGCFGLMRRMGGLFSKTCHCGCASDSVEYSTLLVGYNCTVGSRAAGKDKE